MIKLLPCHTTCTAGCLITSLLGPSSREQRHSCRYSPVSKPAITLPRGRLGGAWSALDYTRSFFPCNKRQINRGEKSTLLPLVSAAKPEMQLRAHTPPWSSQTAPRPVRCLPGSQLEREAPLPSPSRPLPPQGDLAPSSTEDHSHESDWWPLGRGAPHSQTSPSSLPPSSSRKDCLSFPGRTNGHPHHHHQQQPAGPAGCEALGDSAETRPQ